jgi:hypothetical protein
VGRPAALLAVLAALVAWYAVAPHLDGISLWWDIALLSVVILPAVFALVLLALPLWRSRGLLPVGIAFAVLAFALSRAHLDVASNFSKLAAMVFLAWWFLSYFEEVSWVVLVAAIIPWVDAYSVWRGPTKHITSEHENVFSALSVALFLAAAARFRLRVFWTWLALVVGLGLTIVLATWWDVNGLPALPALSLGFLLPNADLLWQRLRRRTAPETAQPASPGSDTART